MTDAYDGPDDLTDEELEGSDDYDYFDDYLSCGCCACCGCDCDYDFDYYADEYSDDELED